MLVVVLRRISEKIVARVVVCPYVYIEVFPRNENEPLLVRIQEIGSFPARTLTISAKWAVVSRDIKV